MELFAKCFLIIAWKSCGMLSSMIQWQNIPLLGGGGNFGLALQCCGGLLKIVVTGLRRLQYYLMKL